MKAIDRPFTNIINGTTQFVVPVFQRDYRWTEAQCEQLWADILAAGASPGDGGHFLGSVVCVATEDSFPGFTRWLLIDGQQRMTNRSERMPCTLPSDESSEPSEPTLMNLSDSW